MQIAIIGAGASGLFLAKLLSRKSGCKVSVFEKSDKVGCKLKASGGGRANLFNTDVRPGHYNEPEFMQHVLDKVGVKEVRKAWEDFGMHIRTDEEGRAYPMTFFSQTALDTLLNDLPKNVNIRCGYEATHLLPVKGGWRINEGKEVFDRVVLCSGSPAGAIPRNRQGYNGYLQSLQLKTKALTPSLVGFRIKNYPKSLEGCRAKAEVRLNRKGKEVFRETGEITFKEDGVSGIVILNASAYYNRMPEKDGCRLLFDFLFEEPGLDTERHLQKHHSLCGLLHPKLNELYRNSPFDPRHFCLEIDSPYDLAFAQVCHGGIALQEVDEYFRIRKHPGLFAAGELLDIDGVCGGYNLFFAFASALVIAENILS